MYFPAKKQLEKMNIKYENHIARRIEKEDFNKYDFIIGMEESNIRPIKRIFDIENSDKIYKLLDFSNNSRDIADPWYTRDFSKAYSDILEGCLGLIKYIKENLLSNK